MITIYTIAYNESVFIKFMIDHYRSRFLNCKIVVYDNESSDDTVDIAKANGCEVISYSTNNQISDKKYLEIKNSCWKTAKTDWVLICDMDELLDITEADLKREDSLGSTIIRAEAYNMVNLEDNLDLPGITHGSRCAPYDKSYCFKKKLIKEINYDPGCHTCKPIGLVKNSEGLYKLYHYKCINPEYQIARYRMYEQRLSEENRKNGWGGHYIKAGEDIKIGFPAWRASAIKVRD
jgi:glycosyltransferase involved in cell wall biosynthesis